MEEIETRERVLVEMAENTFAPKKVHSLFFLEWVEERSRGSRGGEFNWKNKVQFQGKDKEEEKLDRTRNDDDFVSLLDELNHSIDENEEELQVSIAEFPLLYMPYFIDLTPGITQHIPNNHQGRKSTLAELSQLQNQLPISQSTPRPTDRHEYDGDDRVGSLYLK